MEFNEKLQNLRKEKGMTQEELAQALFVSRTAISKWESGRGYPSIDSLKEISKYFNVTVDELLSGEKLISIAEKENKSNIKKMCDLLFGIVDLFCFMLIVLPLYPNTLDGHVYSVNLIYYTQIATFNISLYWMLFFALIVLGVLKLVMTQLDFVKGQLCVTYVSLLLSVLSVIFLGISAEAYAVVLMFVLLVIKAILFLKRMKNS